jgi:hypothetical protein
MALLHDPSVQSSLLARLDRLRPDSTPRWGTMSVDQMLWHVNQGLDATVGRIEPDKMRMPLPPAALKFMVLNFPWMKGAPTNPRYVTTARHDFARELDRCRQLIGEVAARPLDGLASKHPVLGRMSGRDHSRLQAKHLDHHLRQFGV